MKKNHIFSFAGGDLLAKMGAWWFVSYSYYLYVDGAHRSWEQVKTATTRRSVYNRSKKYHVYWLTEVLEMNNLDVHGNTGGLSGAQVKGMAEQVLSVVSKDQGASEIQTLLEHFQEELERRRRS